MRVGSMAGDVDLLSQNVMLRGGLETGLLMGEVYGRLRDRDRRTGRFEPDRLADRCEAMAALGIDEGR